jgi:hypothetical protein
MHFGKLGFVLILFLGRSTSTITLSSKSSINDESTPFTGTGLDEANEEREPISTDTRKLQLAIPCKAGAGPTVHYFSLSIDLIPQGGYDTSRCTLARRQQIGNAINNLLIKYGVGSSGVGDNAAFLARVCSVPIQNPVRRQRRFLQYARVKFIWRGGGGCLYCKSDNFDARQRRLELGRQLQTNYDPNWFRNIYAPQLENVLRNAIDQTIVAGYVDCLGAGPQTLVDVEEISSSQLRYGC